MNAAWYDEGLRAKMNQEYRMREQQAEGLRAQMDQEYRMREQQAEFTRQMEQQRAAERAAAAAHAQQMDIQDRAARQGAFDKMFGFLSPGGGYSSSSIEGMGFPGIEKRIANLLDRPETIKDSGAYKFRFGQGQEALERSLGAKGLLQSGNRLTELTKYGQDMATQEYGQQFDRLARLLGGYQQERSSMFGGLAGSLGGWVGGTAPTWNAWANVSNAAPYWQPYMQQTASKYASDQQVQQAVQQAAHQRAATEYAAAQQRAAAEYVARAQAGHESNRSKSWQQTGFGWAYQ